MKLAIGAGKPLSRAYLRLIKLVRPAPLTSEAEYSRAVALADYLASREHQLGNDELDYFDILCGMIERYEDETVEMPDVDAAEMLRFLIEQRGVTQQTVAKETDIANSTISALLSRKRNLTVAQIKVFAEYFSVAPAVFLPGND